MSESRVCFSSTAERNTRLRLTEAAPKPVRDALKAPSEEPVFRNTVPADHASPPNQKIIYYMINKD